MSLRKYAQLNFSTPMAFATLFPTVRFVIHPCFLASRACPSYGTHLLRRPRILRPACCLCPSSLFDLSFYRRRVLFLSRLSPSLGARSVSFILHRHLHPHPPILHPLTSPVRPSTPFLSPCLTCSLFCHDALVLAVPLYLPPPVVPSSLKAVESNR